MLKPAFGPTICPVCNDNVYFAEEVKSMGKSFHRTCFKCKMCNKLLDSFTANEREGNIYCRTCHMKIVRSPGIQSHWSTFALHPTCGRRSQSQPRLRSHSPSGSDSSYYGNIFKEDGPMQHPTNRTAYHCDDHQDSGHQSSRLSPVNRQQPSIWEESRMYAVRPPRPRWNGPAVRNVHCANCSDTVFANERVDAVGKSYHRLCFKCASCGRLLDRGTACDHKQQVYCQNCHVKNFGSRGLKAGTNLRCE